VRWTVHGERPVYESDWVSLTFADVELPDGRRFDHHVVRVPQEAAAVVIHDEARGVLLLHRHRFVVDTWGWEIPGGRIDAGESAAEAAEREALEETGWRPGPVRLLFSYRPISGLSDQRFHVFAAEGHLRTRAGSRRDGSCRVVRALGASPPDRRGPGHGRLLADRITVVHEPLSATRDFLRSMGLPPGDLGDLPTSDVRFPDGA
jgi:8-oxo-dGTP pyrophosphatase MutT (NUDIX family)